MGYPLQPPKVSIRKKLVPIGGHRLQMAGFRADTWTMKLRKSTLDRVATAYADAVAMGDFESAEGWLATAAFVADREGNRPDRLRSFARRGTAAWTGSIAGSRGQDTGSIVDIQ